MKILFLARRFYPDEGGVEKHLFELSEKLIAKGHSIEVITQSEGNFNSYKKIKIIRIPKTPRNSSEKIHIWKWFWKNRQLINDADIIHAHDVYFWYWPFRFIFLSKKSFVTFHGYETYPIRKKAIVSRKISELLADGNIIVGDFIKKWYKTKPDFVIYGATDIPEVKSQPSEVSHQKSAVFIGRLDEHTGILDYAKAVDILRKKYSDFDFAILGEGKYKGRLKNYNVMGFKKNPEYYLNKYNFAFVSRYLSILEALAAKKLVFALFDNPVKEDYLMMSPFAKFIVVESDSEILAEKVEYYLKNEKEGKDMVDKGFEWVRKQSWDNISSVYLKLWN